MFSPIGWVGKSFITPATRMGLYTEMTHIVKLQWMTRLQPREARGDKKWVKRDTQVTKSLGHTLTPVSALFQLLLFALISARPNSIRQCTQSPHTISWRGIVVGMKMGIKEFSVFGNPIGEPRGLYDKGSYLEKFITDLAWIHADTSSIIIGYLDSDCCWRSVFIVVDRDRHLYFITNTTGHIQRSSNFRWARHRLSWCGSFYRSDASLLTTGPKIETDDTTPLLKKDSQADIINKC